MAVQTEHDGDRINDRPQLHWGGTHKTEKLAVKNWGFGSVHLKKKKINFHFSSFTVTTLYIMQHHF
jgi:hypothetical protein